MTAYRFAALFCAAACLAGSAAAQQSYIDPEFNTCTKTAKDDYETALNVCAELRPDHQPSCRTKAELRRKGRVDQCAAASKKRLEVAAQAARRAAAVKPR